MRVVLNKCGQNTSKVSRIVKKGQIYFSREYTRMVKRNACVVLLSNGKVADIQFFAWNKESGVTLVVYKEIEPDLDKPFFFDNAGCHILRMKPQRYLKLGVTSSPFLSTTAESPDDSFFSCYKKKI